MGRPNKTATPFSEGLNPEENELLDNETPETAETEAGQDASENEDGKDAGKDTGNGIKEGGNAPEEEENKAEEARKVGPEVNSSVQNLLRIFNGYDELYITKAGGVFPKGNKPSYVKDAVLYKNPFYKKK